MKRTLAILLVLLLALSGCSPADPCDDPQGASCTRVLFIGNSYTFVNNLPMMFAELAQAGKHETMVGSSAQGGWTLAEHAQSAETLNLLKSIPWTYVVLQEQSQIPSVPHLRNQEMYPAARALVKQVRGEGATPFFLLTWAHRSGWPEQGMPDYESMQSQIDNAYYEIARELHVRVAPVGKAWHTAVEAHPDLTLWQGDESHPSEQGTYLAACVFYAVIFHESPVGLSYQADLSPEIAAEVQAIASETVLGTP